MSLFCPHIEKQNLIRINSPVVRQIEIILEKNSFKHVKWQVAFFFIKEENEDVIPVSARLKEKKQNKQNF